MSGVIDLTWWQLAIAAGLVLALAATMQFGRLGMGGSLLVAAARTVVQLSLIGLVLEALIVVIGPDPWHSPQYAIPLLGMLLGNTMNGIALGLDRLTESAWRERAVIEHRLMMGQNWQVAVGEIRRNAMRSGMIPIINAMAAAGLVSLPGMMTGQILAGSPPAVAVEYQILIMFTISAGTGFGTMVAVSLGSRRLFDARERLRIDRLDRR